MQHCRLASSHPFSYIHDTDITANTQPETQDCTEGGERQNCNERRKKQRRDDEDDKDLELPEEKHSV